MKIGITYNLKDELPAGAILEAESCEEFDTPHTIDSICGVFEKNGFETAKLGCGIEVAERVKKENVGFVFNIAEGHGGRNRESHTPSLLEMLGIPYSGSDPLTLGLTLDKIVTKKIAAHAGIPVSRYRIVRNLSDLAYIENRLSYPMITKPAWEGSSKGIYNSSKVSDMKGLQKNTESLFERYPAQPILVEEYIEGREITVGIIGNNPPRILGLMEIVNKVSPGEDFFYSLDVKRDWEKLVDYASPPEIGGVLDKHIRHYALLAFKEFGCRDIARIDFRLSRNNKIYMLEINPLPGLSPEYADLVIMSRKQGIGYERLILSILHSALSRYGLLDESARIAKENVSYEAI